MLGVLCPGRGRMSAERRELFGVPTLWVTVPAGGIWEGHRATRAERLLKRHGVRKLLPMRGASTWNISIPAVDPLPLYRTMADRLILWELSRNGIEPERGTVALAGERVDGDLARTAHLLCPRVHTLLLEVECGGELLAMELYRKFGAAVNTTGRAAVCARFSGAGQGGELVLCGRPELRDLQVEVPGLSLPEQLEPIPLLTALWQAGRVDVKDFCLRQNMEN